MLTNLANLHKLCFPAKPWDAEEFAALKKSGCEVIASENAFIVWRTLGDETEIITIGVAPIARRTGTADAMLHIMEKEIGAGKIFLEVAADNVPAQKLYEKHGYEIIATRPKYYDGKTDAIVMQKFLK